MSRTIDDELKKLDAKELKSTETKKEIGPGAGGCVKEIIIPKKTGLPIKVLAWIQALKEADPKNDYWSARRNFERIVNEAVVGGLLTYEGYCEPLGDDAFLWKIEGMLYVYKASGMPGSAELFQSLKDFCRRIKRAQDQYRRNKGVGSQQREKISTFNHFLFSPAKMLDNSATGISFTVPVGDGVVLVQTRKRKESVEWTIRLASTQALAESLFRHNGRWQSIYFVSRKGDFSFEKVINHFLRKSLQKFFQPPHQHQSQRGAAVKVVNR